MAVRKTKETRIGWLVTNVIEHPCYIVLYAGPSFHFGSQDNVAGMLHYISNQPIYSRFLLFRTAISTSLNNFYILVYITFSGDLSINIMSLRSHTPCCYYYLTSS